MSALLLKSAQADFGVASNKKDLGKTLTNLHVVILAAGNSCRMHSAYSKVVHRLAGKPLLAYVVEAASRVGAARIHIVHSNHQPQLAKALKSLVLPPQMLNWVVQEQQLGTANALLAAMVAIPKGSITLVLYGDVPLVDNVTLSAVVAIAAKEEFGLVTGIYNNAIGYGRVVRDRDAKVQRIVEEKDANEQERALCEVSSGILAAASDALTVWLQRVDNNNAQQEYYLPDVIALAVADGIPVQTINVADTETIAGVNDRIQLARLERYVQQQIAQRLMSSGVTLADPWRFDARGEVHISPDVFIDINVLLEGQVTLGSDVLIGPHSVIQDTTIGSNTRIEAYCHIAGAVIGNNCRIGPFARLRPGTVLGDGVHIGNFVETKQTLIGDDSKANHLSYLGDATIGSCVNIGAGVITCNYDGANKHPTRISDGVFIGSGCELVAPITVGKGATVGAGSTISKNVDADSLTLNRAPTRTVGRWKRPRKKTSG